MLSPEVINFPISGAKIQFSKQQTFSSLPMVTRMILTVPGTNECPRSVQDVLDQDVTYYTAKGLNLRILCSIEFISHFVTKGQLTLFTQGGGKDVIFITHTGDMFIWTETMKAVTFFNLPHVNQFKGGYDDGLVQVSLKDMVTQPRKVLNKLDDAMAALSPVDKVHFSWTPDDESICPSSMAKFLYDAGAEVEEASFKIQSHFKSSMDLPHLSLPDAEAVLAHDEVVGSVLLDLDPPEVEDPVSSKVLVVQVTGLIRPDITSQVLAEVRKIKPKPWISLRTETPNHFPTGQDKLKSVRHPRQVTEKLTKTLILHQEKQQSFAFQSSQMMK